MKINTWILLAFMVNTLVSFDNLLQADGTAPCNTGRGGFSTECGINASTGLADRSTSVGRNTNAYRDYSTAVGAFAQATLNQSTVVGAYAKATGTDSTSVGFYAEATSLASTSMGAHSKATALNATSLGSFSWARSKNAMSLGFGAGFNHNIPNVDSPASIAIGSFSNITSSSPGAIAIGGGGDTFRPRIGAQSTGENAIAIGYEARATKPGAIALGANVVANKANTMTVGVPIEVERDDGTSQILIKENIGGNNIRSLLRMVCHTCTPGFMFRQNIPSNLTWFFRMRKNGDIIIDDPITNRTELEIRSGGDLHIGGTLTQASSRNIKTRIELIKSRDILEKLDQLPISHWEYKKDDGKVKHIGPMAEDFHALFKVGTDNKSISSIDTSGVALAAIKALSQKNESIQLALVKKDTEITRLQDQIDELKGMLTSMMFISESTQFVSQTTN